MLLQMNGFGLIVIVWNRARGPAGSVSLHRASTSGQHVLFPSLIWDDLWEKLRQYETEAAAEIKDGRRPSAVSTAVIRKADLAAGDILQITPLL